MATPATPAKTRHCGFHHQDDSLCPTPCLVRVWTGDEWEYSACTGCNLCRDSLTVAA